MSKKAGKGNGAYKDSTTPMACGTTMDPSAVGEIRISESGRVVVVSPERDKLTLITGKRMRTREFSVPIARNWVRRRVEEFVGGNATKKARTADATAPSA